MPLAISSDRNLIKSKSKSGTDNIPNAIRPLVKDMRISKQEAFKVDRTSLVQESDDQDCADMPIRVVVRKRPLSTYEINRDEKDVLDVGVTGGITVNEPKLKVDLSKVRLQ